MNGLLARGRLLIASRGVFARLVAGQLDSRLHRRLLGSHRQIGLWNWVSQNHWGTQLGHCSPDRTFPPGFRFDTALKHLTSLARCRCKSHSFHQALGFDHPFTWLEELVATRTRPRFYPRKRGFHWCRRRACLLFRRRLGRRRSRSLGFATRKMGRRV